MPESDSSNEGHTPNNHICNVIANVTMDNNNSTSNNTSRTELDSHANMPVVGRHCYVINKTGSADVSPFSLDYEPLEGIPMVDAVLMYVCPYSGEECLLILRNALYVQSMPHNLIPPFIIREAGITVKEVPKIHCKDPTSNDHCIIFPKDKFRIPMLLTGIFSYFSTFTPTETQVEECENVYLLTPEGKWNPNIDTYAHNESSMVDWEGNIKETRDRNQIIIENIPDDPMLVSDVNVSKVEDQRIDDLMGQIEALTINDMAHHHVNETSPIYDPTRLCAKMVEASIESKYKASIGSTNISNVSYLVSDNDEAGISEQDEGDDDELKALELGHIDLDTYMSSAAHVRP